jgi:hypothetical protein
MAVLHCKACDTRHLMSTRAIFDQEQYVQTVERFAYRHAHCGLSDRARRELIWGRLVKLMDTAQRRRAIARYN